MPIYTRETLQAQRLPWVEIEDFEFFVLGRVMASNGHPVGPDPDGHVPYWGNYQDQPLPSARTITPSHPKDRIVVISGEVQAESEHGRVTLRKRDYLDIPASGATVTNLGASMAEVARICGHWRRTIRTEICLFRPENPCDYHYHDGDEYWAVFRGHFTLDYHGIKVGMRPGMLLAAGRGYEHGALAPEEQFQAIVMAMPLEGRMRDGHLNTDRNGAATPGREVPAEVFDALRAGQGEPALRPIPPHSPRSAPAHPPPSQLARDAAIPEVSS
jgi:mannose-6-phosphate isomerase-like protein (cupin superfamily)